MFSWKFRDAIERKHEQDVLKVGRVTSYLYEGHCYEFERCDHLSRRPYVRNGLWIIRQFFVNVCVDLYDAVERLERFSYADLKQYEAVERSLSILESYMAYIQRDIDSLTNSWPSGGGVFLRAQTEDQIATSIENSLREVARGEDLLRVMECQATLIKTGVVDFYDELNSKTEQIQEFWQIILQNAYSQQSKEFMKGPYGRMQNGKIDIGCFHVCAIGNGYALLVRNEKELLATGWTIDS